jgi:hypothetical protein
MLITHQTKTTPTQIQQKKKWITFTYHSPLIHKLKNLPKYTNLNIAFGTTNTICNQLCDKVPQNKINPSGIYRLKCINCNSLYVGQTGSSIATRHRENTRYIKTKNPISPYTLNILNKGHE